MRKGIVFLLVLLLWGTVGSAVAWADGMILPETLSPGYLAVRTHVVTVEIKDGYALTRVEQEFYNPHDIAVKGRYLFPVPPEAALTSFQVTLDGQVQQAVRQGPEETNAALYAALAGQRDPSLLQYVNWETLALDLSLPPGGSRRMSLEYEQVLVPSGGLYRYRYVLGTERYSVEPVEQVSVTVHLRLSAGLSSLYSPTYPVTVERLGVNEAQVTWSGQGIVPTEDLDLFFAPAEGGFGAGLLTGQRDGQGHFLFLFSPEAGRAPEQAMPKDIVLVLDRSGSMGGEKIEQARNALQYILGRLGENDRFSIVSFNHGQTVFAATLQPVGVETLAQARRFADGFAADGNTDLDAALRTGLDILARSEPRESALRVVLFLTDGLPTAGLTDDALIAGSVATVNSELQARLHVFGVGYDVNTHLLDRLADDSNGTVTYVQPGENLEAVLTGFYDRIAYPVLTDVAVEFEGMETSDLYPQTVPDLFQGDTLLLAGRYQAAADTAVVRVRGQAGGEAREYIYRFGLDQAGDHDFVSRLWATRRIGALLDRVRVEGETEALVSEIRDLGLAYGLVTPYTTFVVAAQSAGAASAANMALYGQADLNSVSGQTTVQARVQNQMYQQAGQSNLAAGANVLNAGHSSLAQVADVTIDLALLRGQKPPTEPVTVEWLARNVGIDRYVAFGSAEYFALAADRDARTFLQSGANVVFRYNGQVVAVQDTTAGKSGAADAGQVPSSLGALAREIGRRLEAAIRPF